ncbi:pyridoxal kinase-like [Hibiscus syriacus]|uniref:pyridoxal kinase-like n=1 Tax=Hibiscus syriacus TaxID=106335 RepID=UPI0019221ED8|nr:pyridoxal kinase-like [Hibiscus syriacus]
MASPPILSLALPLNTVEFSAFNLTQFRCGSNQFSTVLKSYRVPDIKGQVLNGRELLDLIEGLEENNLLYYTHLLTGYIGSVSFLNSVLEVVDKLRSINPSLIYVCDPVMGDEGKLYVPEDLASVYREKVVPVASMMTPNQFEAELLTKLRIGSETDGREACNILHAAGPSKEQAPQQFKIVIPRIPAYFTVRKIFLRSLVLLTHPINPAPLQEWSLRALGLSLESHIFELLEGKVELFVVHGKHKQNAYTAKGAKCIKSVCFSEGAFFFVCMIAHVLSFTVCTSFFVYRLCTLETMLMNNHIFRNRRSNDALLLGWSNKYPDNLDRAAELAVSSLQALLVRTVNDYTSVGFDSKSGSLEIQLIQSQDDIRNPKLTFRAKKYT